MVTLLSPLAASFSSPGKKRVGFTHGYSLVEVVFASTVFLLGVAAAYTGVGFVTRLSRDALLREKATALARTVSDNLLTRGIVLIPGNYGNPDDLLADGIQTGNRSTELLCNGSSYFPFCTSDYPRGGGFLLPDLTRALGVGVTISGSSPDDYELIYRGDRFRVHWNIVDNMPVSGQKTVSVLVTWRPYGGANPETHAVRRGRYVQLTFIKGRGL